MPLFVMLTGYLNINKTVSRKYYRGCIRVLGSYLLFSIITILFRKYYLHENCSWLQLGLGILDFTAIPYGWYVEMWIGLFLLTPFLNVAYKALAGQRQKLALIATLVLLTVFPSLLNHHGVQLIPDYWVGGKLLTYFFIGCYIREYRPEVPKWKLALLLVSSCLVMPVYNIIFSQGLQLYQLEGFYGVCTLFISVAFFLLCYRVDFSSVWVRTVLMKVSMLSLDMYLCCYMVDRFVYPWFLGRYFVDQSQFGGWFFVVVPVVFTGSFLIAWVKEIIFGLFMKR